MQTNTFNKKYLFRMHKFDKICFYKIASIFRSLSYLFSFFSSKIIIIIFSSIFIQGKMSNSIPFEEYFVDIHKNVSFEQDSQKREIFHSQVYKMKQQLFNFENSYYGDVERNLLLVKIKIDDSIQRFKAESASQTLGVTQKNVLKVLQARLNTLNSDIDHLLKQGILTLYMDLCDLKEKFFKMKINQKCQALIKGTIEIITHPLKLFFIYQEYHSTRNSYTKKKNILSLRNLSHKSPQKQYNKATDFDMKLIKQIEESLSCKTVSELLEAYMNKQEKQINETLEVCRICQQKIKLENMEKHVKTCQKKCLLKQQIQQKSELIHNLLDDLKQQFNLLNQKPERTKEQESLRKVAKILLCRERKKERCGIRRFSLAGGKSQKCFKDKFEKIIEQYQYEQGEHFILHKILLACLQKGYLEKRANTIQINALNSDQNESEQFLEKDLKSQHKMQQLDSIKMSVSTKKIKLQNYTSLEYESIKSGQIFNFENEKNLPQKSSYLSSNYVRCMSRTKQSLRKKSMEIQQEDLWRHYVSLQDIQFEEAQKLSMSLSNLEILKFLGQGSFGKVYLVRRIETGDIYALKIIKICDGYDEKQFEVIKNQHEIFKKIAGDHLVKAPFSFSEKQSHMFVLQYLPGGDLRKMLDDEVYFEEEKAKYYLAEIVLAIEHLHKFEIIHRDLKPENLVIDKDGHLKLTDFGLSEFQIKVKLEKSMRLCQEAKDIKRRKMRRSAGIWGNRDSIKLIGTPDYIAPEIISQISVKNYTIDWWSLGVMAYQLLVGSRPFSAETIEEVIDNITSYRIEWPEIGYEEGMITPEAKDLISQLLNTDFVNRLGANGADQIMCHPFFRDIDWRNLKKSKPPMIPKMSSNDYDELKEDKQLRKEVNRLVGTSKKSNNKLKLDRFIRFDLLGDETIQNVQKLYEQKNSRIEKLKTIHKLQLQSTQKSGSKND